MKRIGIQIDFAGGYGRGVLRGVMQFANLRTDWSAVYFPGAGRSRSSQHRDRVLADGLEHIEEADISS